MNTGPKASYKLFVHRREWVHRRESVIPGNAQVTEGKHMARQPFRCTNQLADTIYKLVIRPDL